MQQSLSEQAQKLFSEIYVGEYYAASSSKGLQAASVSQSYGDYPIFLSVSAYGENLRLNWLLAECNLLVI